MDFNNAEVLAAFAEGIAFGFQQGYEKAKDDDQRG